MAHRWGGGTRVGTGYWGLWGRLVELGTAGDRCCHLLQPQCPQTGVGDHEGSGVVVWKGLKLSWPEPKPLSCGSGAGRGPVCGDPCGATGDGVSCARKWAEASRGCSFPHRRRQSLWSQMPGPAAVSTMGGQGSPWGWGHRGGVGGLVVAPQRLAAGRCREPHVHDTGKARHVPPGG